MPSPSGPTIAQLLLSTDAVSVNASTPFRLRSGWASPVYIDVRKTLSSVSARTAIVAAALDTIRDAGLAPDIIVGAEAAGIPLATLLADRLKLPLQYARKKALGFGKNAQLEGSLVPGASALLVDDLLTDGKSKEVFCLAIRNAGETVDDILTIFDYQVFRPQLESVLAARLHSLCNWADILQVARASNALSSAELDLIDLFLSDAAGWSARHGGIQALP
jgi:orotate phosphoribosyltransferase